MKKALINKQIKKKIDRKCFFCDVCDYESLHVHRIEYGEKGGRYTESNSLVVCANDHAKIHSGKIIIDKKYFSTSGCVLHYWMDGEEYWVKC